MYSKLLAAKIPELISEPFLQLDFSPAGVKVIGQKTMRLGHSFIRSDGHEEGIFAKWDWDGHRLNVYNDRYGFYPLYYCNTGSTIKLSTSIPKLIDTGAPTDLDDAALAVFLRIGSFISEDTPFRSIRALPPGARLIWKSGHMKLSYSFPRGSKLKIKKKEAVEQFIHLFRKAIQKRLPHGQEFAIPLSGGRDSRHILFELLQCGFSPTTCLTTQYYPPRATPDVEIASKVTHALNLEHHIVNQPKSELKTLIRYIFLTNFCTTTPSHFILAVSDFIRNKFNVIYDGIGGDILSAGLFLNKDRALLFKENRLDRLADMLLTNCYGGSGFREPMLVRALSSSALKRFNRSLAANNLVNELKRHSESISPFRSFCFFNRTRRDIALMPFRAFMYTPTVHTPYLDYDLFDFLISLPLEFVLEHSFHTETINQAYPQWSNIQYSKWKEISNRKAREHYHYYAREIMLHFIKEKHSKYLSSFKLMPRLLRCLIDADYSKSVSYLGPLIIYINQLERLIKGYRFY